jgi:hypothetical protein
VTAGVSDRIDKVTVTESADSTFYDSPATELPVGFGHDVRMDPTITPREVSIVPELSVRHGREAVEFYKAAFGASEVYRVGGTDDAPSVVAQLAVGDASFWVADESPPHGNFSPESLGGGTVRMLLIVDDPEAAVERARRPAPTRCMR